MELFLKKEVVRANKSNNLTGGFLRKVNVLLKWLCGFLS